MANVDELMAEMGWVRRLARGLLRDADAADDVAQEAWLVANEHPPGDRPLRPWLHRVVLNLVRMRSRGDVRRITRELASESNAMPTSAELLERVETQRMLADEVIALREPYRSTIVLHYVEGLSSAEIARRLDLAPATVRQRLKHALDELRDRIRAREDGPKRGWLAALVPFAQTNSHVLGALAMKKLIATIVILLLLLGGGAWFLATRHRSDAANSTTATTATQHNPLGLATSIGGHPVDVPAWLAQIGAPSRRIAGRVMFANKPMPNATVRLGVNLSSPHGRVPSMTPGPPFVEVAKRRTGPTGEFDFGTLPAASFVISAEAESTSPVSLGVAAADPHANTDRLVLVLGDCHLHVTGIVRDSASPIAHARLRVAGLAGTESDASGKYSVCMPLSDYPNIRVDADGYGGVNLQIPPVFGDFHRDVILVPEATIAGTVVDETGAAVASAIVSARVIIADGTDEASNVDTVADDSGHFQLSGLAPTRYTLGAFSTDGASDEHPTVIAVAGAATRDIRLVVAKRARLRGHVTMAGVPIAGAQVGVGRGTFLRWNLATAYTQADGAFVVDGVPLGTAVLSVFPYEVKRPTSIIVDRLDPPEIGIEVAATSTLRGRVTRHDVPVAGAQVECSLVRFATATSDASGMYVLEGVPAGNGNLYANNLKAFTNHAVVVAAASDQTVDLELEGGGEVRGVVVDEAGAPVSSVLVVLDSHADDTCRSLTDANGTFACATLAGHLDYEPAVYPSTTQERPYEPAGGKFALVHVNDGDALIQNLRLAIKHDQLAIRGKVVDDAGTTIPDARVTIIGANAWGEQHRTRADGEGGFIIDGLVFRKTTICARAVPTAVRPMSFTSRRVRPASRSSSSTPAVSTARWSASRCRPGCSRKRRWVGMATSRKRSSPATTSRWRG